MPTEAPCLGAKAPPDLPAVGDRVRLRGRTAVGTLAGLNERLWAFVRWEHLPGPRICHLHELVRAEKSP